MGSFKEEDPEDWSALVKKWHDIKRVGGVDSRNT